MEEISIEQLSRPLKTIQAANTELLAELELIVGKLSAHISEAGARGEAAGPQQISDDIAAAIASLKDATETFHERAGGADSESLAAHRERIQTLEAENGLLKSEVAELRQQADQMLDLLEQQQECIQRADSMSNAVRDLQRSFKANVAR